MTYETFVENIDTTNGQHHPFQIFANTKTEKIIGAIAHIRTIHDVYNVVNYYILEYDVISLFVTIDFPKAALSLETDFVGIFKLEDKKWCVEILPYTKEGVKLPLITDTKLINRLLAQHTGNCPPMREMEIIIHQN